MATFVRVVEGNSLSAAARAQRLSLPAVSRQLRALEADLGTTLVVRSTRRLRVTDAGRDWYEHCRRVLAQVEEARQAVRGKRGAHGRLVVSASLTFGSWAIVPRLPALAQRHPHLVIDLRLEDQLINLVGEGVDVAVRSGTPPPDSTTVVAHPIFATHRVLVAGPRWLRKHGTIREPSELAPLAGLIQATPAGTVVPWTLLREDDGEARVVEMEGRIRTNAPSALRELALSGAGIAYLPEWLVAADIEDGSLRRVLPRWRSAPIMTWAVYRAELRGTPRLRAFLDSLPRSGNEVERPA
jgi:DNA-binding transcriptional LysR family regulator